MSFRRHLYGSAGLGQLWSRLMRLSLLNLMMALAALCMARPALGNLPAGLNGEVTETAVKAAFLYRFLSYVEWPAAAFPSSGSPYVIAVIGAADMTEQLKRLVAGRMVEARPIEVRQLGVNDLLNHVHVLYLGDLPPPQFEQVLGRAQQHSILSVTNHKDGQVNTSVIQFKLLGKRVSFDVDLEAAEKSKLKISSRMLSVAHQVSRSGS